MINQHRKHLIIDAERLRPATNTAQRLMDARIKKMARSSVKTLNKLINQGSMNGSN